MKASGRILGFALSALLASGSLTALVPSGARAGELGLVDGLWVMKKVDERYEGDDVQEDLHLTLDKTGDHAGHPVTMDVRWLKKDYGKQKGLIVYFVGPAYAAGITLNMTIKPYMDDDRWLYFPETNLIRRVMASDKYSNFMGTDFTYQDLSEKEPDEENHKLLRIEEFKGAQCYVVETTPKELVGDYYSRKVTWVDKDRLVKLRIQYYNRAGKFKKQYDPEDWRQINGIWTPLRLVMEDFISGHKTVIERANVRYNQGIKDDFFQPKNVDCVVYKDGQFSLIPFEQRPTRVWEKRKQQIGHGRKIPAQPEPTPKKPGQ